MLERIRGELRSVDDHGAIVAVDAFDYEVMVPSGDAARLRLSVGGPIELVLLHYLESQANGAVFRPRLVGFTSERDRRFFELLTSVKGIGYRKALRALAMPIATIARAVAEKDVDKWAHEAWDLREKHLVYAASPSLTPHSSRSVSPPSHALPRLCTYFPNSTESRESERGTARVSCHHNSSGAVKRPMV